MERLRGIVVSRPAQEPPASLTFSNGKTGTKPFGPLGLQRFDEVAVDERHRTSQRLESVGSQLQRCSGEVDPVILCYSRSLE
jgi:hypothetical protein